MPPSKRYTGLSSLNTAIKRHTLPVTCPACSEEMMARVFQKHCLEKHNLDPSTCCVWCFGRVSWESRTKNQNSGHLNVCFRQFTDKCINVSSTIHTADLQPKRMRREPMFPPNDFFGHENLSRALPPEAFGIFKELNHQHRVDLFEDDTLNRAASYVRLFEQHKHHTDWFHVMVKAVTFQSFLEAVLDDKRVSLLPFSCWCDGGPYEEARFRQHRHMILVCIPKKHFEDRVWPKVKATEKPAGGYQAKGFQRIQTAMHLVNALGYVCKRESRCHSKFGAKKGPMQDKHFHIFESLPIDYMLPLCLQWKGGVQKALFQLKFQNISVRRLDRKTLILEGSQYKQKIKDFYGFESGWVLPVRKGYAPCSEESADCFVYLVDDKKLYFKYSHENEKLNEKDWLRRQVEGGNCFYEAFKEALWTPRPSDQEKMNLVMHMWEETKHFESENKLLKEEIENLKNRLNVLEGRHSEEMKGLKRKYNEEMMNLNEEIKSLKRRDAQNVHVTIHNYVEKRSQSAPPNL